LFNTSVNCLASFGNNIFAGTAQSGVFLSTDNGANWSLRRNGLADSSNYAFAVCDTIIFAGGRSGKIYVSSDKGTNWKLLTGGLPDIYNINFLAVNGTSIFAGTSGGGLWMRSLSEILPVELTSFAADIANGNVRLRWSTETELNNMGFDIERSKNKIDWITRGFVKGNQNSTLPITYTYIDKPGGESTKYYYRLKQIDFTGSFKYSFVIEVDVTEPSIFTLSQNYPNPFNPSTQISYSLPSASQVKFIVYNTLGQTINVLANGFKSKGNYSVNFNAVDLPSGIYFYRLEAGQFSQVKKMMLLK